MLTRTILSAALVVVTVALFAVPGGRAQDKKDEKPPLAPTAANVAYGKLDRQVLDVYAPKDAKNLPVVFWIHGGGWQAGDKKDVQLKPKVFTERGFVFVSTNYRLLPNVEMGDIIRDVAKSVKWVHDNVAMHG